MFFEQRAFDVRCEWGEHGVSVLAPLSDVVVVVDVLSFTTSVEIAVSRGARVYPFRGPREEAAALAAAVGAELADARRYGSWFSLSPASLTSIPAGIRLVLPSPNGATLSLGAGATPLLAGCLRNAQAVARAASLYGRKIAVIAAGERWPGDGSLRPCFEDLVGAGAILQYLTGRLSPEAFSAVAAFQAAQSRLDELLAGCSSGVELIERGFTEDVRLASELNVSVCAPVLREGAFQAG